MDTVLKVFAIDPGTQDCGFSFYFDGRLEDRGFVSSREEDPYDRCTAIAKHLFYEISVHQPDLVICERPLKNGPGARSGHIFILHHFCGMLHGLLAHHSIPFEYVEVSAWKGNLPKDVHQPRIIDKIKGKFSIDITGDEEDTIDAIGLGYWYIYENKKRKKEEDE